MYSAYNNQYYIQDLQNMRDRIDKQLQQLTQPQQQTPITQNFQLAPSQNQNAIKYVENTDDVSKELVYNDTLFTNKNYTKMWLKNTRGDIRTFELNEIFVPDDKDNQIANLQSQIEELRKELSNNEQHVNSNDNEQTSKSKSTRVSISKSSNAE